MGGGRFTGVILHSSISYHQVHIVTPATQGRPGRLWRLYVSTEFTICGGSQLFRCSNPCSRTPGAQELCAKSVKAGYPVML